jgi:hypothetical protein
MKIYILTFFLFLCAFSSAHAELVCPASDKTPDKVSIDAGNDLDSPYVDYNRDLKDFGTAFVVEEFFRTKDTLFNFIKAVYGTIDNALKDYRAKNNLDDDSMYFLFKGGNVLRIVANQVFYLLPPEARELLSKTYGENFKRSDADFSVFVDETKLNGLDYETVMNELSVLTYRALNKLRQDFSTEPQKYFNFLQLKTAYAEEELDAYYKRLKNIAAVLNKDNINWFGAKFIQLQLLNEHSKSPLRCAYEGQFDYLYTLDPNKAGFIIGDPLTDRPNWIMNSINKTLQWTVGDFPKKLVKFYLLRSKVQFEYSYEKAGVLIRKPIGGELIDVSFPHRDDFRLRHFLNNKDPMIATYNLALNAGGENFTIKAESLRGLARDLYEVVFEQFSRPWEASKYVKRINRLFFLAITDILISYGTGSVRGKIYLYELKENVISVIKKLFTAESNKEITDLINRLNRTTEDLSKDWPDMFTANLMWRGIAKLVSDELWLKPKENDRKEFESFLNVIESNLEIIDKINNMPSYKVNQEDIYNVTMDSLI